jgi:hypothetical protein
LYVTFSFPPTYHFAYGCSHSHSFVNGSNQVTRSRPSVSQNSSGSRS